MMSMETSSAFAPELYIPRGTLDISFYQKAFGAKEHFRFSNEDESIHVVELAIEGAIFHIHEAMPNSFFKSPDTLNHSTVCIGLFVDDVAKVFNSCVAAGAKIINPVTDHDYGYRQSMIQDPFGHLWQIQKKI